DKIDLLKVFSNKNFCDDIGNLRNILILLRKHCVEYPAGGSSCTYLEQICDNLKEQLINRYVYKQNKIFSDIENNDDYYHVLVAIVVDIAYTNPKTIPNCFRLISYLFSLCNADKIEELSIDILEKVSIDFNSDFFQIWLHRIVLKYTCINIYSKFSSKICKLPLKNKPLFDYSFLDIINSSLLRTIIQNYNIFNQEKFDALDKEISKDEIPFNFYKMKDLLYLESI
ncbi:MAG: hypothetical protein J6T41_05840, partial [Neisseriaceae bacterium]|nr:hypothetical protein [Neisseriaceae bacterium]